MNYTCEVSLVTSYAVVSVFVKYLYCGCDCTREVCVQVRTSSRMHIRRFERRLLERNARVRTTNN